LDALRFGDPGSARTRHLVDGVIRGVGGYGNCVGVPTVGGELVFHSSYQGNPLVNVMAIGLLEERLLTRAAAPGPGNLVVLFGSADHLDEVTAVCERWGLPSAVIGRVTADGDISVVEGSRSGSGIEIARIPAAALTSDAIVHPRMSQPPAMRRLAPAPGATDPSGDRLPERGMDPGAVLLRLIGSPNLASRAPVYEQYDSNVQARTVGAPGHG